MGPMNLVGGTKHAAGAAGSGTQFFATLWVIAGAISWPPTRCPLSKDLLISFLDAAFLWTGVDNPRVKRENYAVKKSQKIVNSLDERIPREVPPLPRFR